MAPGPKMKTGNRFSALDEVALSEPQSKRNKTTFNPLEPFPNLPKTINYKNPRFIVIAPQSENKPLSSVSIFALRKAIDAISTEYEQISQLRDGKILILTKNQTVADRFISTKNLSNLCPVTITLHNQLNSSKGIVYAPCLINVPEVEIISEMKMQKVTDVYKFTKQVDGNQRPTGLMLFTFDTFQTPNTVEIGWYNARVTEYIPNPMRCRNCQLLGHTTKRCNGTPMCQICNLPPHANSECSRTLCANCLASHPSSSKDCPKFIQMKEILKIKTQKKCSLADAKRIYNDQFPSQLNTNQDTFASKAKQSNPALTSSPPTESISTTHVTNNKKIPDLQIVTDNHTNKKTHFIQSNNTEQNLPSSSELPPPSLPPKSLQISTQAIAAGLKKNKQINTTTLTSNEYSNNTSSNSTPTNNNTNKTDKNSNLNTSQSSSTQSSSSPLSKTTQYLIDNNQYFVPTPMDDDDSP
ncbi:uncharacterized protein LOC129940222 [Eupeodes corollae]|uniref:uncharacterized protein LOC129940222 n=1 Tax=Eupeodes corollae TaxID=290404 RepID=UPI002491DAD7|nr:uncharacterized protein LOC129940222 [Eupeodes corollae]